MKIKNQGAASFADHEMRLNWKSRRVEGSIREKWQWCQDSFLTIAGSRLKRLKVWHCLFLVTKNLTSWCHQRCQITKVFYSKMKQELKSWNLLLSVFALHPEESLPNLKFGCSSSEITCFSSACNVAGSQAGVQKFSWDSLPVRFYPAVRRPAQFLEVNSSYIFPGTRDAHIFSWSIMQFQMYMLFFAFCLILLFVQFVRTYVSGIHLSNCRFVRLFFEWYASDETNSCYDRAQWINDIISRSIITKSKDQKHLKAYGHVPLGAAGHRGFVKALAINGASGAQMSPALKASHRPSGALGAGHFERQHRVTAPFPSSALIRQQAASTCSSCWIALPPPWKVLW